MKIFVLALMVMLAFMPQSVFAQSACAPSSGLGPCINQIYTWALGISALLALLMMVLGGFKVITAQGNAEQSASGKGYIMSAVVGMVLLFAAFVILNTINPQLVNFRNFVDDPAFGTQPQQPRE